MQQNLENTETKKSWLNLKKKFYFKGKYSRQNLLYKNIKETYHSSSSLSGDGDLVIILIILEQKIWIAIFGASEIFTEINT